MAAKHAIEKATAASPDVERIEPDTAIRIGEWYWIKQDEDDWTLEADEAYKFIHRDGRLLMCVSHIGSNHADFEVCSERDTCSETVMFDDWDSSVTPEPNWQAIIEDRVQLEQENIQKTTKKIADKAASLHLQNAEGHSLQESNAPQQSFLPSVEVESPEKFKTALVLAQEKEFPELIERIEQASTALQVQTRNRFLPELLKAGKVRELIKGVEDKLFTVELYIGFGEKVKQIKKGKPAPTETPISIRQLLLYMDEETLFDYASGGMDFKRLAAFDKWVCKKKTLARILPEPRAVVAFQVRRNEKDYGTSTSVAESLTKAHWNEQNMRTYLLVRNGTNVHRIACPLDFRPRLVPLNDELSQAYIEEDRNFDFDKHEYDVTRETITPDDVRYDGHVLRRMAMIKQYNRIILILQGLIHRTDIFQPMPRVSLADPSTLQKWAHVIRDEETLDSGHVDFAEYKAQLDKSIRKGKVVSVSATKTRDWHQTHKYGGYYGEWYYQNSCPEIYIVTGVNRERTEVKVMHAHVYGPNSYTNGAWSYDTEYRGGERSGRWAHWAVPIQHVFNITDYLQNDFKLFLCNRAARGKYLEWAPHLLTAEDFYLGRKGLSIDQEIISEHLKAGGGPLPPSMKDAEYEKAKKSRKKKLTT